MAKNRRTWISAIIGILALIIVIAFSPSPLYQPHGIFLPSKATPRSEILPDTVVQLQNPPSGGEIMGSINIERHYPAPHRLATEEIAKLAQTLSAKAGANTVVVNLFRVGQVTSTNYIYVFQATAYYTPTVKSSLESFL